MRGSSRGGGGGGGAEESSQHCVGTSGVCWAKHGQSAQLEAMQVLVAAGAPYRASVLQRAVLIAKGDLFVDGPASGAILDLSELRKLLMHVKRHTASPAAQELRHKVDQHG